jgi:hypothetical protein
MPNFCVQIRCDYKDTTGLVLDLRPADLQSDEGIHDGGDDSSTLIDSSKNWSVDSLVGKVVHNLTDGSYGTITANTATIVSVVLALGVGNDWDDGDAYTIQADEDGVLRWPNRSPAARINKPEYSGSHDGGNNAAVLGDSNDPWAGMNLVGMVVHNITDGSLGWITANDESTVTATLTEGSGNDWDNGDVYLIADPRFGDAYSDADSYQPAVRTIDGLRLLEFSRSLTSRLYVPLATAFPPSWWTVALELWKGSDNSNSQIAFEMGLVAPFSVRIWRRNAGGFMAVEHGAGESVSGTDHLDGVSLLQGIPADDVDYWHEGVVTIDGSSPAADAVTVAADDKAIWLGRGLSGLYFDGLIRSVRVWNRPMSSLEIDFAFQSLASDGIDHSIEDRAVVSLQVWTDDTGDWSRITNQQAATRRFVMATVDGKARMQIAASVAGKVRPDSELGGKLFTINFNDFPSAIPMVIQESGWSAVFDIVLDRDCPGHYSCTITRESGGCVIVHFDVEAAT